MRLAEAIGGFRSRVDMAESGRSQPLDDKDVRALRDATTKPRLLSVTPIKQGSANSAPGR